MDVDILVQSGLVGVVMSGFVFLLREIGKKELEKDKQWQTAIAIENERYRISTQEIIARYEENSKALLKAINGLSKQVTTNTATLILHDARATNGDTKGLNVQEVVSMLMNES